MALKTLHFVQGLSRTPLLSIPRYLTNIILENISPQKYIENRKSENLKFQKPRFTNKCPVKEHEQTTNTVPAVRKDACNLLSLDAKKPKNLLLKHVWMVWGVWGDAEKSYESVSVEFGLFGHEKSQENHKNHFSSF